MRRAVCRQRGREACRPCRVRFRAKARRLFRILDGLRAVDEQAAVETALFLGDPVATLVLANEDDCRCRTARWRFDELHVGIPSVGEGVFPTSRTFRRYVLRCANVRMAVVGRTLLDSCSQYLRG